MTATFTHIATHIDRGALVVEILSPALNDFDLAHAIANEIERALRPLPVARLILDLKNVEILTSVGLIVFARVLKAANAKQVGVVLCNASQVVGEVLTISRLAKDRLEESQMALAADVDAAIALFEEKG